MRVFKNKWFNRWTRHENISNDVLCQAAKEIIIGKVEANLGGYLFKKRLQRTDGGKRRGYRVVVGYKKPDVERIIFLYAFAKSDKTNISDKEEAALNIVAEYFISAGDEQIIELLSTNSIYEVRCYE